MRGTIPQVSFVTVGNDAFGFKVVGQVRDTTHRLSVIARGIGAFMDQIRESASGFKQEIDDAGIALTDDHRRSRVRVDALINFIENSVVVLVHVFERKRCQPDELRRERWRGSDAARDHVNQSGLPPDTRQFPGFPAGSVPGTNLQS